MIFINIPINKTLEMRKKHKNYCNLYVKPKLQQFREEILELYNSVPNISIKIYLKNISDLLEELLDKFDIIATGKFEELVKLIMYDSVKNQKASIVDKYEKANKAYFILTLLMLRKGYERNLKEQLKTIYNYENFSKGNNICCIADSYIKIQEYLNEEINNRLGILRKKSDTKSLKSKCDIFIEILNEILSINDEVVNMNRDSINKKIKELKNTNKGKIGDFEKYLSKLRDNIKVNDVTKWTAYKLVKILNLNVCPYCNREYITTIESKSKKRYRAELDHFIPKSRFPFFSLSLFNLIPSCGVCNSGFKKDTNFIPTTKKEYDKFISDIKDTEFTTISPYSTCLKEYEEKSLFKFDLKENNVNKYKIAISYASQVDKEVIRLMNNFCVKEIYKENHKDILEDIYIKKNIINSGYKKTMCEYIKEKFNLSDEYVNSIIDRVFFGHYLDDKSHSKRPLNKLAYDLLKEGN